MDSTAPPPASERAGSYLLAQGGPDGFWAFHPNRLPPSPPLKIDAGLRDRLDAGNQALGRLDGITLLLPDPDQFLYTFIRKEAVLSSQIEGTQSSLSDLLLFEHEAAPGVPREDAQVTANYIAAMNHGITEILRPGGTPLSARLLRDVHAILLETGRGSEQAPGEFRRDQNWLGGSRPGNARFVPPPWPQVEPAMSDLEKFLHDQPVATPVLVKAALAHAQFETIHPFIDGNGRVGRLLITLLLCSQGVLKRPLLYLSLYLKRNRDAYYDHLQRVRTDGAWEDWLRFFLDGVIEVAESTTDATRRLVAMIERDRQTIHSMGRGAATTHRVHDLAARYVVVRPAAAARALGITDPPVYNAIARLEQAGILREVTGRQRGKAYVYDEYLASVQMSARQRLCALARAHHELVQDRGGEALLAGCSRAGSDGARPSRLGFASRAHADAQRQCNAVAGERRARRPRGREVGDGVVGAGRGSGGDVLEGAIGSQT